MLKKYEVEGGNILPTLLSRIECRNNTPSLLYYVHRTNGGESCNIYGLIKEDNGIFYCDLVLV